MNNSKFLTIIMIFISVFFINIIYCKANTKHQIYIIPNDDLGEISMILVGDGDTIDSNNPLISLSKNGYKLEGWYINEELTKKYDFSTPVTQDFTLYA